MINTNGQLPKAEIKYSKLEQASIILGIASLLLTCLIFVFWTLPYPAPYPLSNPVIFRKVVDISLISAWFLNPLLWLSGLRISIIALRRKEQRKLFPTLGLIMIILDTIPMLFLIPYSFFVAAS